MDFRVRARARVRAKVRVEAFASRVRCRPNPNTLTYTQDQRTHHEALPVTKGTKYAANFWIHQYDYVAAHHMGCTA